MWSVQNCEILSMSQSAGGIQTLKFTFSFVSSFLFCSKERVDSFSPYILMYLVRDTKLAPCCLYSF